MLCQVAGDLGCPSAWGDQADGFVWSGSQSEALQGEGSKLDLPPEKVRVEGVDTGSPSVGHAGSHHDVLLLDDVQCAGEPQQFGGLLR